LASKAEKKILKLPLKPNSTMNFKRSIYLVLSAFLIVGLSACGSSNSDKGKDSDEFKDAEKSLENQIKDVVYNIPSPTEIPYLLQATGADYNPSLVNPRTKVDQYTTHTDKAALNLGIYASDIGYLSSYEKAQEAIDYLNACKTLADGLGVIGTFDIDILKRFEANISNKDSLSYLLDETIKQTDKFLKDESRNKLAALVVTGSFVEGLYVSTGLVKSYPKDILKDDDRNKVLEPLIRVVIQQKESVADLMKMLSVVEQTGPVAGIISDLKDLEKAYANLNIEENLKNSRADLVLSDKALSEVTTIVERLRKSIVD
jgi:hypothetical protein